MKYTIHKDGYTLKCETDMDWWTLNAKILELMNIKDSGLLLSADHAARIVKTTLEAGARRAVGNIGKTRKR